VVDAYFCTVIISFISVALVVALGGLYALRRRLEFYRREYFDLLKVVQRLQASHIDLLSISKPDSVWEGRIDGVVETLQEIRADIERLHPEGDRHE